jgi:Zn-dependent metalloprotease
MATLRPPAYPYVPAWLVLLAGCAPQEYGFEAPEPSADLARVEALARAHLQANAGDYGIQDVERFTTKRVFVDDLGTGHAHLQQVVDGVPVFEGEAIVHLDPDGSVGGITQDLHPHIDVDTQPALSAEQAAGTAVASWGSWDLLTDEPLTDLWVLRVADQDHLAWRVQLERIDGSAETSKPLLFVDAHDGAVLRQWDNLFTAAAEGTGSSSYDGDVSLTTWKTGDRYVLEDSAHHIGTFDLDGSQPRQGSQYASQAAVPSDDDNRWTDRDDQAAINAHFAASETMAYFAEAHGRVGIDGSGGPGDHSSASGSGKVISVYVRYGTNYTNAWWDGSRVTLGEGDGTQMGSMTCVELVGHELTHGVTQETANLTYQDESGALNETVSDIFGLMVELRVDGVISDDTWLLGEDVVTPGTPGDAKRYMADPSRDGMSPDHYDDLYTGREDNGGVHSNSGISNLAFYLMAAGGDHPQRASETVVGMGPDDAADIWYRALTTYMSSRTNMAGARTATLEAAEDLFGEDSLQWLAVGDAWAAVGVGPYLTPEDDTEPEDTGDIVEPEDTGEPPEEDPVETDGACGAYADIYEGRVTGTNQASWEPEGSWYESGAGVHYGCLDGPRDAELDLYLYRWNGYSWVAVAGGRTQGSVEAVAYSGGPGYYSWLVHSRSGGGAYEFGLTTP